MLAMDRSVPVQRILHVLAAYLRARASLRATAVTYSGRPSAAAEEVRDLAQRSQFYFKKKTIVEYSREILSFLKKSGEILSFHCS